MLTGKRVIIATLSGLLTGFICLGLASSAPGDLPVPAAWQLITSRMLAGFVIGISIFQMKHWSIHGTVIGALFSIPLAFSGMMAPDSPEFSKTSMFIFTIILGMIYGLLIEFITSVLFKAKMNPARMSEQISEPV